MKVLSKKEEYPLIYKIICDFSRYFVLKRLNSALFT